jgi:cell division initiation protein
MVRAAKAQSDNLKETAEASAKSILDELQHKVKVAVKEYESLMIQRELVLKNLKKISSDIEESVSTAIKGEELASIQSFKEAAEETGKGKVLYLKSYGNKGSKGNRQNFR